MIAEFFLYCEMFPEKKNLLEKTHFMLSIVFPKMEPFMRCGENMIEPGRPQMAV